LKPENENLSNLCKFIDIYDIWQDDKPEFPTANLLNDLFWEDPWTFRDRMIQQNYKLSDDNKQRMMTIKGEIKSVIDSNLKKGIIKLIDPVLLSFTYEYSSHYSEYFGKMIYLFVDQKNNKVSFRLTNEDQREQLIREVQKLNPITLGGHKTALGGNFKDLSPEILKSLVTILLELDQEIPF
jgi:hypothetical protein